LIQIFYQSKKEDIKENDLGVSFPNLISLNASKGINDDLDFFGVQLS